MDTKIKAILPILLFILACSGGSGGGDGAGESAVTEMQMGVTESAAIETEGDVDTYTIRVAETNRFLNINCNEKSSGSGVDLLVTVFEEDAAGNRIRLFGKHKPQDATPPANIDMAIYIAQPKDLVITVRDLMDDDTSPDIFYHLTCNFLDTGQDNHDFANARAMNIGASDVYYDTIEEVGEVDCFTFSTDVSGVHSVTVDHESQEYLYSSVNLSMVLYDQAGNRIQSVTAPNDTILSFLEPEDDPYYVTVHDSDGMHVDAASTYAVSVVSVTADEAMVNDVWETADVAALDADGACIINGAIEYASASSSDENGPDVDWYQFSLPDTFSDFQSVRMVISGGEEVNTASILRVSVHDASLETITAHDYYCSGGPYENRFMTESGTHYVSVSPLNPDRLGSRAGYQILLEPADLDDDNDNTENDATPLDSGEQIDGVISYHSDVDWYSITLDTTTNGILAVELTSDGSIIDYQVSIWRGVELIKRISDLSSGGDAVHLKTAVYIPRDHQGAAEYFIKVGDAQNDEGSDVPYRLSVTETGVPASVPNIPQIGWGAVMRYYSEGNEQTESGGEYTDVELEIFSGFQPTYLANTDWLDFRSNVLPDGVDVTNNIDGTATISFPWIAGYVDYQGDRDIFEIDFDKIAADGEETEWYYDVQVRLIVPEPGTEVEYVWKLYRDRNRNGIIMDDPTSPDGYKACAGDDTPQVREGLDQTVPSGDETFWVGSEWGEDAKFYFGMSDFNYEHLPGSDEPLAENPSPDNDWGYDAPYYFQLQLIYHPGAAWPD